MALLVWLEYFVSLSCFDLKKNVYHVDKDLSELYLPENHGTRVLETAEFVVIFIFEDLFYLYLCSFWGVLQL